VLTTYDVENNSGRIGKIHILEGIAKIQNIVISNLRIILKELIVV